MSRNHKYKRPTSDSSSSGYASSSGSDSDNDEYERLIYIIKRSHRFKLGATSDKLLKLVPYLFSKLTTDFNIDILHIKDYPTTDSNSKFRTYLIHQGVVVSEGFNYTVEPIHAEEDVINRFLKRDRNFRNGGLTKNAAKWQRLLRTNAEECVQRRRKKVVKVDTNVDEDNGFRRFRYELFGGYGFNKSVPCSA